MRTITLEEHFVCPGFVAGPGKEFIAQLRAPGSPGEDFEQLSNIGDQRIAEMDAAGIDMQVLSLNAPGVEQADAAEQLPVSRRSQRFPRRSREEASEALRRPLRRCPPQRPTRRRRSWSAGPAAGLQGRADQRPHARTLSRRQVLFADPGARRSAQCPDLSASDRAAEGRGRGVFRRVFAAGDGACSRARAGAGTSRPRCTSSA